MNDPFLKKYIQQLGDDEPIDRFYAIQILARAGEEAIPYLLDSLKHERWVIRYNTARVLGRMSISSSRVLEALEIAMSKEEDPGVIDRLTTALIVLDPIGYRTKVFIREEFINELLILQFCCQILDKRIARKSFDAWYWQSQKKVVFFCISKIEEELSETDYEKIELTKETKDYILQTHPLLQKKSSSNSLGHKEWLQEACDRISIFIQARENVD